MILAHRQELIWQARDKMQLITGEQVDIEMGQYRAETDRNLFHPRSNIIVSTIQTHTSGGDGAGRLTKFDPKDFGLLIIDEAHHATSSTYRRVIDWYMQNPDLVVLGVTATPDRSDEEALGQLFGEVAFDYEIIDAIKDGWLVPILQDMVHVSGINFADVRTTAGDLNGADLDAVMKSEKNVQGVAGATIDIIGDKRGIGFAASVVHAKMLADIFNRHRQGMAAFVHGGTPTEDRQKIVKDFALGKIQFLWNCGVFTEGFDDSGVEVISMARPTKSRSLYAQMAGRATRPHESIAHKLNNYPSATMRTMAIERSVKPSCLIIDFVGNSGRHKLMSTADILGGNVSDEVVSSAINIAKKSGKPVDMAKLLEEEEKRAEELRERHLQEAARKARLVARTTYTKHSVNPFDILDLKPVKPRGWDNVKQFSEKQRAVLRQKIGVDPDSISYAEGRQLIDTMFDRWKNNKCTLKQAAALQKFGYSKKESADMSFEQASAAMDAIARNGWKRPKVEVKKMPMPRREPEVAVAFEDDVPF
jgi:superfamily II DNA or RNA helicase